MKSILILGASCAVLTACAQPPAPVAHKGDQFYGKNGARQFASNTVQKPDYTPPKPMIAAPVADMEVAELAEPVVTQPLPATLPKPSQPQEGFKTVSFSADEATTEAVPALEPLPLVAIEPAAQPHATPVVSTAKAPTLSELNARSSNFIWPTQGSIVSRFGPKKNGLVNDGINIAAKEGEPIWAAAAGEVAYAGNELKGYGNMMIVRHANGWMTAYAHTSDMLVKKGDRVEQGDLIGYVGQSGAVNTAQLHFGIREGKTPVDPEGLLPRRMASAQ